MKAPCPVLTRRHLLSLAVSTFLAGCGGGGTDAVGTAPAPVAGSGSGNSGTLGGNPGGTGSAGGASGTQTAGAPGTGGTGMTASGSISGFGSVVINGIRFDDTLAAIRVDGLSAQPTDLRLGMVALAQGVRAAVATTPLPTAIASQIEVWKTAQGTVSAVANVGAFVQFSVAGLTVQTDAGTALEGLATVAGIAPGQSLAVWALQENTEATRWRATRVAVVAPSVTVTSGLFVSQGNTVNGWALKTEGDASVLAGLQNGQLVRVEGMANASGTELKVLSVTRSGLTTYTQQDMELEGVATTPLANNRFMLSGVTVDVGALRASAVPTITVGARFEVKGSLQNGVLTAAEIEVEDDDALKDVEIEARIEQFTALSNFVLRGQRCDASNVQRIENGTASDLRVGVKVKVKGVKSGDVLLVTQLEIDD